MSSDRPLEQCVFAPDYSDRYARSQPLSVSIAHEVRQPIAICTTGAQTPLRWLDAEPPQLEEGRRALGPVIRSFDRAVGVIEGVCALAKKAAPRRNWAEINEAILEV